MLPNVTYIYETCTPPGNKNIGCNRARAGYDGVFFLPMACNLQAEHAGKATEQLRSHAFACSEQHMLLAFYNMFACCQDTCQDHRLLPHDMPTSAWLHHPGLQSHMLQGPVACWQVSV